MVDVLNFVYWVPFKLWAGLLGMCNLAWGLHTSRLMLDDMSTHVGGVVCLGTSAVIRVVLV